MYTLIPVVFRLALNNTQLIRLYADYDPRIKPLYYTIRQWAQVKEVSGNPMSGPKLTNYALSMFVFHYLTVCSPAVLPTVEQLAKLAGTASVILEIATSSNVMSKIL